MADAAEAAIGGSDIVEGSVEDSVTSAFAMSIDGVSWTPGSGGGTGARRFSGRGSGFGAGFGANFGANFGADAGCWIA